MNLCKYRNIFGRPKEGAHAWRLGNLAIVDVLFTILGAAIIAWAMQWNFWVTLLVVFLVGIAAHRLFCVRTTVDTWFFRE